MPRKGKSNSKENQFPNYYYFQEPRSTRKISNTLASFPNSKDQCQSVLSTGQNEECYLKTINTILDLVAEFGITYKEKSVENIKFCVNEMNLKGKNLTHIAFLITLRIKEQPPPDMDRKVLEKEFQNDVIHQIKSVMPSKALQLDFIDRATIQLKAKNLKERKFDLNILINIDTKQNILIEERVTEPELPSIEDEGIINEFFKRKKLKTSPVKLKTFASSSSYFGCFLAIVSSVLCGLSFVLKKRSFLKMNDATFYLNKRWWMAHSLMVIGDVLHFTAFFFTSAVLVCTLQMLLVLVVAVASSRILGERYNAYWKYGFTLSLGGCLLINVHVPKEPNVETIELFTYLITAPKFVAYNVTLMIATCMMMRYAIPKWGKVNSLAYVVQSAIFGSTAVVALKGVLLIFTDKLLHWLPLTSALIFSMSLLLQLEYLNKALNSYNTLVVATQYYVLYSALVIITSFMLFEVWKSRSDEAICVILLALATITLGVLIFAIFQENDATFDFSKLFHGSEIEDTSTN